MEERMPEQRQQEFSPAFLLFTGLDKVVYEFRNIPETFLDHRLSVPVAAEGLPRYEAIIR